MRYQYQDEDHGHIILIFFTQHWSIISKLKINLSLYAKRNRQNYREINNCQE